MFQKPTFGSNTSGFGSFNAGASTSSPFGGFKPGGASAFGASPAFPSATPAQPATGSGLFGASNTSTGLFGAPAAATPAPAFGAPTSTGFGFGAANNTGGLFGASNTSTGLFGANQQQNTSTFGAKPAGFGFGSAATPAANTSGVFGAPATNTGLFGATTNNTMSGGGLFGGTGGAFGQQQQQTGTGHTKFNPVIGTDVMVKSGTSQNISIKHHCITCMKEYENKSLEELRLEDYIAGRKGSTSAVFPSFQQQETKPLFGATSFGAPATTSAPGVFGSAGLGTSSAFGQTNTFSFGGGAQNTNTTSSLFGANKPAFGATATPGSGLFGATTTQAPAFGTSTNTFGFPASTQNQPSGGMFGAKPATSAFGASTFGTNTFGGGLFGAKPQASVASTAPAFGTSTNAFGANTGASSSLFGANSTFGKPAAPSFGFGGANTQTNTLGGAFAAKPAGTGFPTLNTGNNMSLFPQGQTLNFNTGNTTLGGLGGSSLGGFGNTSTLGGNALSMPTLGNTQFGNNTILSGSAMNNVHEQILNLAARPYGDSPLFKDLVPDSTTTAEEALKPTNPAAVKAVLDRSGYRVTSPDAVHIKLHPCAPHTHKKSLFDGLEESDASLEEKLSLKPSRKRLVLRPHADRDNRTDSVDALSRPRTLEDSATITSTTTNKQRQEEEARNKNKLQQQQTEVDRREEGDNLRGINTDLEDSSERHSSWLGSSKLPWSDTGEKSIENETPRIYPDLDKEVPIQMSERRASWLTTKPLRKPPTINPDLAENSVRELRTEPRAEPRSSLSMLDKENIDYLSVSEEENVSTRQMPPHPTGVKLTRPGYYTIPTLDEMISYMSSDGSCVVPHLTIGRTNYGNVYYDTEIDVAGMDLDNLVHFLNKEVIVYPNDEDKPPVGEGLNRRAIVTLDRVWPRDKTEKRPINDPKRLIKMDYEGKLRRVCDKHDTKFIEYRPQTGSWVFRVEHFSKYGLTDSDEEDEVAPEVLRKQIVVNEAMQKNAANVVQPPLQSVVGLGGLSSPNDSIFSMPMNQTSLSLTKGPAKAFEMDTEDTNETQSMYPDTDRAFSVKSPTSELARLEHRHSHSVQLMKASLYTDHECMDDDEVSISTGDQLVPAATAAVATFLAPYAVKNTFVETPVAMDTVLPATEAIMPPLVVPPHTIVLKYHRKVPPFKLTIAGRTGCAYISDPALSRARHSRVGFGPKAALAFVNTRQNMATRNKSSDLRSLHEYTRARAEHDWSEHVVVRMSLQHSQESLSRQMLSLLEASTLVPSADSTPRLLVNAAPSSRRRLLDALARTDRRSDGGHTKKFGVTQEYCHQVWQLCEALWGADLDNDGVPDNSESGIVGRHRSFLDWLTAAVCDVTDRELANPLPTDPKDDSDLHSARVLTLLCGSRLTEACKVAREAGDLSLAAILAQASGDEATRTLIGRQLSQWRDSGADSLISDHRLSILKLVSGQYDRALATADWLTALNCVARYICPQVPSLEQIITTYESWFRDNGNLDNSDNRDNGNWDLTTCDDSAMAQLPIPDYMRQADCDFITGSRRILDLRYELIRARALNTQPRLQPATYTADPLDHSLSFLVGAWLSHPTEESITSLAMSLEACGEWHFAALVIAYHPNDRIRASLMKELLSRNVPSKATSPQHEEKLSLIRRLQVPESWLFLAQAHRAKYEKLPLIEAEHLVAAEQWNAAHKVLLEDILPSVVLADNVESISSLLEKLHAAAERHLVSGWECGGEALYHYLYVCTEFRSTSEWCMRSGPLSSRLGALTRAISRLDTRTPCMALARAEMSARAAAAAEAAGAAAAARAHLLRELQPPPGGPAHHAIDIATELAAQS